MEQSRVQSGEFIANIAIPAPGVEKAAFFHFYR